MQAKIAQALVAAGGRTFADEAEAATFAKANLDFATNGAYGGATSCVEVEGADGAFLVCDMGSGLREFGIDVSLNVTPQEVPDPIPFTDDRRHASYDRAAVDSKAIGPSGPGPGMPITPTWPCVSDSHFWITRWMISPTASVKIAK